MGLYEFKRDDAYSFARNRFAKTRERGDELQFEICPYCHGGANSKDKYTFSISLSTGQFKCLRASCDTHGNFITLARDFNFSLGRDIDNYYSNKEKFRKFKVKQVETKDRAVELMKSRGISESITRRYELTIAEKLGDSIIVFPFFDEKSELKFVKYRDMDYFKGKTRINKKGETVDANKEWSEADCMPILFGMKQCDDKFDRLIITEGQIDSLSVSEAGIGNAVSVPTGATGFTWVPYCWNWFSKFKELIVFGDLESGKMSLLEDLKKRFPNTIKHVRSEDYKGCKDANEILTKYGRQEVKRAIENAITIPVKRVKELADVKSIDIYSMEKIKTGIKKIDGLLGGLYHGQVILLTGKRGEGKSTLAGQFLVEALEQGKNVFAYSGELQEYFFKRWIDLQIAGERNIVQNTRLDGTKTFLITNSVIDKINSWYRGRFYIYDNNIIDDDELEDLVKTIEKAVMQYGIDIILIDNLMTALDVGMGVDLYRAQSKFVNKLCKMAKRLDVVVLLVVHPRKNGSGGDENDEVSGSADITNRVDVVMTYKRGKDIPEDERFLSISKNRLTGKVTKGNGIHLYYSDISKRITDDPETFKKNYGWEAITDGFMDIAENEPSPFD